MRIGTPGEMHRQSVDQFESRLRSYVEVPPRPVRWTRRARRIGRLLGWLVAGLLFGCAVYVLGMLIMLFVLLFVSPL